MVHMVEIVPEQWSPRRAPSLLSALSARIGRVDFLPAGLSLRILPAQSLSQHEA